MLTQIDHVGIAVADLEEEVERYRRTFGLEPIHRERMQDQGVEEVLFAVGESYVQLLGALGPTRPWAGSWTGAARACTTSGTASRT
jgi:methylmalonyl-CoA/ethylmalonyl-CoA epimerase